MNRKLLLSYAGAILVLPGSVLIFIPALVSWLSHGTRFGANPASYVDPVFWLGIFSGVFGIGLASWTNRLFLTVGDGTPAPWAPPKQFVVRGPYCLVRNPMMLAVFLMLASEALVLRCPAISIWLAVFVSINVIYIPLSEEKGLVKRFGNDYLEFYQNVPRWLPRLTPWKQSKEN
jgi:protein-S-isoprenylcysteine O-methyltransferase Ste14